MMEKNMDTDNTSITVAWEDEDNRHSFLLVLEDYGLKLLRANDIDEDHCEISLYGPKEEVARFREDFNEGSFTVLDNMSRSLESDEDYEGWLDNEVWHRKQLASYAAMAESSWPKEIL